MELVNKHKENKKNKGKGGKPRRKIMVQITLATNSERKNILVNTDATLSSIIRENGIDTTGATIMLKGNVVSAFDLDRTLSQCNVVDGESVIMNVTVKAAAAFEVKFENNVLTVVTDIEQSTITAGLAELVAKDDKGNAVYGASISSSGNGDVNEFSFTGNTYIDGKLALTKVFPMGTTTDDIQKFYGEALLAAKKYTAQIQQAAAAKTAEITALFPTDEAPTTEGDAE